MESLVLRNYRDSDAVAVSELFREVYGDRYLKIDVYLPCLINQNHADKRWHSLVAVEGERIRGHATLYRQSEKAHDAELALSAVHPDTRGQNIATRLGEQLLTHAQALGCRSVSIKQVTHHPYTQRMALNLGFHNTGLLPDYVRSPFGCKMPESIVVGVRAIDGYQRPLPAQVWPPSCRTFMHRLADVFGVGAGATRWRGASVQVEQHGNRHEMLLEKLDPELLSQLRALPRHWLISIHLQLSRHFAGDLHSLNAIGFAFTGLAPAHDNCGGWLALFHRGYRPRKLALHCPHMQTLHDQIRRQIGSGDLPPV
ncbi:N-acetyltransferase [Pseudomonas sp. CFBP13508]|jgi:GNAT superfamily N-acetyltransferase|uniref:GNAT family N-acetyltransferase n=1 Tax=Pseudomonas mercuritolerans TaxID=2951809 RepID=A0ABT2Y277_9PSED|nr:MULTISPECIES: GNAT family N-acetyltransferase [Pseudomonas]MBR7197674.1 GNAT family N-acetyltransferase [Pseudomonas sp. 14A]MCV2225046.1 GNAT family N-acetyltransferase [Pseudomonas mercuritolerans]TKJ74945.1 N-acetyltransferase [Pseudomonas sp. CFBP13508]